MIISILPYIVTICNSYFHYLDIISDYENVTPLQLNNITVWLYFEIVYHNYVIMSMPNGYMKRGQVMDNYYPRLRDLREDHDLSQQQIAEYLGMKQPQYSRCSESSSELLCHWRWREYQACRCCLEFKLCIIGNVGIHTPYKWWDYTCENTAGNL